MGGYTDSPGSFWALLCLYQGSVSHTVWPLEKGLPHFQLLKTPSPLASFGWANMSPGHGFSWWPLRTSTQGLKHIK